MWLTPFAKAAIGKMLARIGITTRVQANRERAIKFGDLTSSNVVAIEEVYVQHRDVTRNSLAAYLKPDGLTAAIKDFNLHLAIKGEAKYTPNGIEVTVEEVGVYAKETYDFLNDDTPYYYPGCNGCKDQPLGYWKDGVGLVTNDSLNEWRKTHNKGGDFLVYSDIKVTRLNPPDVFVVPF